MKINHDATGIVCIVMYDDLKLNKVCLQCFTKNMTQQVLIPYKVQS